MRNRFSDLIKDGVASFNYVPITSDMPEKDPICIAYNNIFSIASDTHMSITADGMRIITGHMINTPQWEKFIYSHNWGGIQWGNSVNEPYWSLASFLSGYGLIGKKTVLNGDVVYIVQPCSDKEEECCCPNCCHTHESMIPQSLYMITKDIIKLKECYKDSKNLKEVAQKMNESLYIDGNNWVNYNDCICGLVKNKVIIL